jgi:hypothetical protein
MVHHEWTAEPMRMASISSRHSHRSPALTAVKWLVLTALVIVVLAAPTIILSLVG